MKSPAVCPTGRERTWGQEDIIVSKTDLKGIITYANRTFLQVAGYSEEEVIGQPHSLIRHPDMPRCVFKLLWDTIQAEREIFAYVKNLCKNGDHYWVFAHVTPTFDAAHRVTGYHSNRRCPDRPQLQLFEDLYRQLLAEERKAADWRAGMDAATQMLMAVLALKKLTYDEFMFTV